MPHSPLNPVGDPMTYLTQLDDTQISFGSGSSINADDIPNGTSNFFLTKGAQSISGSKYFSNKIINNASGSIFRSLTLMQDELIAGNLQVNGTITVDANGPGGTYGSFIYFSQDGAWLKYYGSPSFILDTNRSFGCNDLIVSKIKLTVVNNINAIEFVNTQGYPSRICQTTDTQPLYIDTLGSDLYIGTTVDSKSITIHNDKAIFSKITTFSGSTFTTGNTNVNGKVLATTTSGSAFRYLTVFNDTFMDGILRIKGNDLYVDYDNTAGSLGARIYFMGTNGLIKYINLASTFTFSHKITFATAQTFSTSTSGSSISHLLVPTKLQAGAFVCDSFKIRQTPTTETITPNKTFTINLNGTNYKVPCVAA